MKRCGARYGLILTMLLVATPVLAVPETSLTSKVDPSKELLNRLKGNKKLLAAIEKYLGHPAAPEAIALKKLTKFDLKLDPLNYTLPQGALPSKPIAVGTQVAKNCSPLQQTSSVSFNETRSDTVSHEFSYGFTEGVSASFTGGLPGTAEATVTATVEFNQSVSNAVSKTIETSWAQTMNVAVDPGMATPVQLVASKYNYDNIPFSTTARADGNALLTFDYTFSKSLGPVIPLDIAINLNDYLEPKDRIFKLKGVLNGAVSDSSASVDWGRSVRADCGSNKGSASAGRAQTLAPGEFKKDPSKPPVKLRGTVRVR